MSPGRAKAGEKQLKMNPNPLLLAIPASCDFAGSTLMFIALTMCPPSVYQMMRGIITVITAMLSIIFLKKQQYRHHWVGLACIILGVAEVGYIAIAYESGDEESASGGSVALGIILLLISQLFTGSMFIVEEHFIGDYYLDPMKVVGTEGMWGVCYYIFLLPFMQMIPCTGTDGLHALCNFGYLENSAYAFYQMSGNIAIPLLSLGMMLSIACFNVFGITTTKVASAAQRSTIDTSRTLVIWFFSCILGLEDFHYEAIFGFIFLVFGTLLYNEIIVLPIWGFDKYTKEALASRAGAAKRDANYIGLSPGAGYDANRNKRALQKAEDEHYDSAGLANPSADDHELIEDDD